MREVGDGEGFCDPDPQRCVGGILPISYPYLPPRSPLLGDASCTGALLHLGVWARCLCFCSRTDLTPSNEAAIYEIMK